MQKKEAAIIIGGICFVLVLAIVIQIKTVNSNNSIVLQTQSNDNLRDDLLIIREKYDNMSLELARQEKILEETRKRSTQDNPELKQKELELKENNVLLRFN